jgi:hypothetical protein
MRGTHAGCAARAVAVPEIDHSGTDAGQPERLPVGEVTPPDGDRGRGERGERLVGPQGCPKRSPACDDRTPGRGPARAQQENAPGQAERPRVRRHLRDEGGGPSRGAIGVAEGEGAERRDAADRDLAHAAQHPMLVRAELGGVHAAMSCQVDGGLPRVSGRLAQFEVPARRQVEQTRPRGCGG